MISANKKIFTDDKMRVNHLWPLYIIAVIVAYGVLSMSEGFHPGLRLVAAFSVGLLVFLLVASKVVLVTPQDRRLYNTLKTVAFGAVIVSVVIAILQFNTGEGRGSPDSGLIGCKVKQTFVCRDDSCHLVMEQVRCPQGKATFVRK